MRRQLRRISDLLLIALLVAIICAGLPLLAPTSVFAAVHKVSSPISAVPASAML